MRLLKSSILPIIISLVFIGGFYLGSFNTQRENANPSELFSYAAKTNKINQMLDYIEQEYVDSMDREELLDETIEFMLQKLDPHSYYITARDVQAMSEPLEGSFDGIGVQFSIQKDTVVVVDPISGGPSEKVGIMAGDRIVEVDSLLVAGNGITNAKVMKLLKGPGGTEVKLGVARNNNPDLLNFTITRDKIPIYSVDIGYMIAPEVGYVKVSRFAKTTYEEFISKTNPLLNQGMKKLILDLRGNGGGFMDAAIRIADEFLLKGNLIVYTEGRARPREEYFSTENGSLQDVDVIVLIDEGSASASEIVAGALQDNDRGSIMGRRSFGKGLVQEQTGWPDGSATRLTIARYYTPTGRCIQRPYENGNEDYHKQLTDRFENGELEDSSSIALEDSIPFVTAGGKTVYGGGGIMPDVFIPIDTSGGSLYLSALYYNGLFYQFSFDYTDSHRDELNNFETIDEFVANFKIEGDIESEFYKYAEKNGIKRSEFGINRSRSLIHNRLKAGIARNVFGNDGFYPVVHQQDNTVLEAIQ
ncbi:MAG: S41 family peptidase [Salibacteraceae bacterium]